MTRAPRRSTPCQKNQFPRTSRLAATTALFAALVSSSSSLSAETKKFICTQDFGTGEEADLKTQICELSGGDCPYLPPPGNSKSKTLKELAADIKAAIPVDVKPANPKDPRAAHCDALLNTLNQQSTTLRNTSSTDEAATREATSRLVGTLSDVFQSGCKTNQDEGLASLGLTMMGYAGDVVATAGIVNPPLLPIGIGVGVVSRLGKGLIQFIQNLRNGPNQFSEGQICVVEKAVRMNLCHHRKIHYTLQNWEKLLELRKKSQIQSFETFKASVESRKLARSNFSENVCLPKVSDQVWKLSRDLGAIQMADTQNDPVTSCRKLTRFFDSNRRLFEDSLACSQVRRWKARAASEPQAVSKERGAYETRLKRIPETSGSKMKGPSREAIERFCTNLEATQGWKEKDCEAPGRAAQRNGLWSEILKETPSIAWAAGVLQEDQAWLSLESAEKKWETQLNQARDLIKNECMKSGEPSPKCTASAVQAQLNGLEAAKNDLFAARKALSLGSDELKDETGRATAALTDALSKLATLSKDAGEASKLEQARNSAQAELDGKESDWKQELETLSALRTAAISKNSSTLLQKKLEIDKIDAQIREKKASFGQQRALLKAQIERHVGDLAVRGSNVNAALAPVREQLDQSAAYFEKFGKRGQFDSPEWKGFLENWDKLQYSQEELTDLFNKEREHQAELRTIDALIRGEQAGELGRSNFESLKRDYSDALLYTGIPVLYRELNGKADAWFSGESDNRREPPKEKSFAFNAKKLDSSQKEPTVFKAYQEAAQHSLEKSRGFFTRYYSLASELKGQEEFQDGKGSSILDLLGYEPNEARYESKKVQKALREFTQTPRGILSSMVNGLEVTFDPNRTYDRVNREYHEKYQAFEAKPFELKRRPLSEMSCLPGN